MAERQTVGEFSVNSLEFSLKCVIYFRKEPPTDQELLKNLAIIKLKQKNAALIDQKYPNVKDHAALKRDETGQKAAFPQYDEYEVMPGKPRNSKD